MPKSSNQKLKLLYLMKIFLENTDQSHALTVRELIDELARYEIRAERKSVYDDIEQLRVFGIDVRVMRDRQVRYYVHDRSVEACELGLLIDAVNSSRVITDKRSKALVKRLETLVSKHDVAMLRKCVSASGTVKAESEEIFCNVDMINRAILANRRIGFRMFEWNADKRRVLIGNGEFFCVSPWALIRDGEAYCMLGYNSETQRLVNYRVDKMLELYIDRRAREGQGAFDVFDIEAMAGQAFGALGGQTCHVRLWCDASLADEVIDRFGKGVIISRLDEGFEFTAKVALNRQFYSWVLGLGKRVRVVSPDFVSEQIAAYARETLDIYR